MIHCRWLTLRENFSIIIISKFPNFQPYWCIFILHIFSKPFILLCHFNSNLCWLFHVKNIVKLLIRVWMNLHKRVIVIVFVITYCYCRKYWLKLSWCEIKYAIISWLVADSLLKLRCPKTWSLRVHTSVFCFTPWISNLTNFCAINVIGSN